MSRLILLLIVSAPWPRPWPQPATSPAPDSSVASADGTSGVPSNTGAGVLTQEEMTAIDARAIKRYGLKWDKGTCGMICACPRLMLVWKELIGDERPDVGEASTTMKQPPRRTHLEYRRSGLFGRQRIAVEVEDTQQPETSKPSSPRAPTTAPSPAASDCPACRAGDSGVARPGHT